MDIRNQIRQVNTVLSATLDLYRVWAKKHQLSYNALLILYTLDDQQNCTQKQICEWWALPKQTVHGILVDFEKRGYLSLSANEQNKRERLITFTERGKTFAKAILEPLYRMEETAMERLGDKGREQLLSSNTNYYELLKEEMKDGHVG